MLLAGGGGGDDVEVELFVDAGAGPSHWCEDVLWMLDGRRGEDGRIGVCACVRRGVLGMIVLYAATLK